MRRNCYWVRKFPMPVKSEINRTRTGIRVIKIDAARSIWNDGGLANGRFLITARGWAITIV
jgi:hypothetical protein